MNKEKKFIYNVKQANFYMQNEIYPVEVDTHYTTKKVFFVFNNDDQLESLFKIWVESKGKYDDKKSAS